MKNFKGDQFKIDLEKKRKALGMNKTEFAELLGIESQYYGQISNGKRTGERRFIEIAKATGLDPLLYIDQVIIDPSSCFTREAMERWPVLNHILMAANNNNPELLYNMFKFALDEQKNK